MDRNGLAILRGGVKKISVADVSAIYGRVFVAILIRGRNHSASWSVCTNALPTKALHIK